MSANPITVLGNILLTGSLSFGNQLTEFPADPQPNEFIFLNNNLYVYTTVSGVYVWFPLIRNLPSSYVHTQGGASLTWIVQHNLNCAASNLMYQISNAAGVLQSAASIVFNDDNSFTLTFNEAITGSVVVFGAQDVDLGEATVDTISVGSENQVTITDTGINMAAGTSINIGGDAVVTQSQLAAAIAAIQNSSYSIPG